jgi:death-on-curing protein
MPEPRWVNRATLDVIHARLLKHYGGAPGVRGGGDALIESALMRPRHKLAFEPGSSLAILAAAYLYGLTKNHGYVDGNKRVGFGAASSFLRKNGLRLTATQDEAYQLVLDVVEDRITEPEVVQWIEQHTAPINPS